MAVTIELPDWIEEDLRSEWADLERHTLEGLAVEAYRKKKIGLHKVVQMLGFESSWEGINFLSERGVYPNYDVEDFEKDLATLRRLDQKMPSRGRLVVEMKNEK
jgi:predicted HTH domain antitoxin